MHTRRIRTEDSKDAEVETIKTVSCYDFSPLGRFLLLTVSL